MLIRSIFLFGLLSALGAQADQGTKFKVVCGFHSSADMVASLNQQIEAISNVVKVSTPSVLPESGATYAGICVTVEYRP